EDDVKAVTLDDPARLSVEHGQVSGARVAGDVGAAVRTVLSAGPKALVMKRGADGAGVYLPGAEAIDAEPFAVEVYNVLGGGDAFASGLIYGYLKGWDWHKSARMGNACGAIVVTRHGCANFMPYEQEVLSFIQQRG